MRFRTTSVPALAVVLVLAAVPAVRAAEDILIADFEGTDYGDWKVEGEAFGPGPARGTLPGQMRVSGFLGKGLVNTFYKGDRTTGTLTSPPFRIERPYINFLIGGGGYKDQTCIQLLVGGKVVRSATGPNTRPGGSERLHWDGWDVRDLMGKEAVIRIVDKRTLGWGHINVDHIVQSDRLRRETPPRLVPATRTLAVDRRYLHLPVKNGAPKRRMKVTVGERVVDEFSIELADAEPDFWVFLDLGPYRGRKAVVSVDRLPEGSKALDLLRLDDRVPGAETMYREPYRPQVHFTPMRGWNNDPNGLVFYDGEYHLYFQHNPYGRNWGNMHWGHAVSRDLVHWRQLPIAIYPHRFGDWVFSGSAAVDEHNTAGWQKGDEKVIVAAYTSTGRGECIAYSNDRGRTFTEYEGNPVVKHSGRDPKIIWYAPGKHWVMAVYDQRGRSRGIAFYTSPNLKEWTFRSRIDGYFECPELFPLAVDGDPNKTRWVVYAGDGAYAVGSFDGKTFTPDHPGKHRFNWGNCFYASQTFNNIPPEDGRRIQIAWGRTGHPAMPFNQQMNFPVELTLRTTEEGVRMFAEPVREIALLHAGAHTWKDVPLAEGRPGPLKEPVGEFLHVRAVIDPGQAKTVGLRLRSVPITWNAERKELACDRCKAPLPLGKDGKLYVEAIVDRLSVEVFGGHGRIYMPVRAIPPKQNRTVEAWAEGGRARLVSLEVWDLKSAWETK